MSDQIHTNARTTPITRKEIQSSPQPQRLFAKPFGVSRLTILKWQGREDVVDRSHRPHTLQTTLTPLQEYVVVALRTTLLLPLDDLFTVTRECVSPAVSRSGLHRCLKRHGVSDLKALLPVEEGATAPVKRLKTYDPGFVHVDVTTCHGCQIRPSPAICSPPLIAPLGGSTLKSIRVGRPRLRGHSWLVFSRKPPSSSKRCSRITGRSVPIGFARRGSGNRQGGIPLIRSAVPRALTIG